MSATKPVQEPPHASKWEMVRQKCRQRRPDVLAVNHVCGFPFCRCTHPGQHPLATITNDGGGVTTPKTAPYPDERIERATQ